MRDEAYSTWLALEYARLQREIDDSIIAIGRANRIGASRRRESALAIRRIDALIGDLDKKNAAFYKDDYTKIFRSGYANKSLDMASVYGRDMGPLGPISSTDRSFLSRERARGLKNSRSALDQTRQRFASDILKADPKMATLAARDGHKMVDAHGRMYGIGSYGDLVTNSAASRAWNRGGLEAVKRVVGDTGNVVISDGPNCGLRSHSDPETANGMVLPASEASSFLSAHPSCQRSFFPEPKPGDGKGVKTALERLTKAAKVTGVAAGAVGSVVAYNNRLEIVSALNRHMLKNMPEWERFDLMIRSVQRELSLIPDQTAGNVKDIRSLRPLDNSPIGIAGRVHDDALNYLRASDLDLSPTSRQIMGIGSADDRMTITSKIARYEEFYTANRKAQMSDRLLTNFDDAEQALRREFAQMVVGGDGALNSVAGNVAKRGSDYGAKTRTKILNGPADKFFSKVQGLLPRSDSARLTLPRIRNTEEAGGGLRRAIRGRLDIGQWVRFTGTGKIKGKNVGSMMINRNGLLRGGLQYTSDGVLLPRLNFVPKFAPIRISSRVNRSAVDGAINSISGQFRVLVPGPFTPSVNFNFDLRALHIADLFDVRNVRMADLKKLSLDNLKLRSLALESQWRLMGKVDVHNVWRIKWEDLNYLLRKTDDDVFMTGDRSFTFVRRFQTEKLRLLGVDYFKNPKLARENFRRNFGNDVSSLMQREVDMAIKHAQDFQETAKSVASLVTDRDKLIRPLKNYTVERVEDVQVFLRGIKEVERAGLEAGDGFFSRWKAAIKAGNDSAWNKLVASVSQSDSKILAHIMSTHKRYFVDMPAERRRKMFTVIRDGELQTVIRETSWKDKIRIWGEEINEIGNRFGVNAESARRIKDGVSREIRLVQGAMNRLRQDYPRDEIARMISSHFSNAKLKIRSVKNWDDFFSLGDDAVEAFGRFGKWLSDLPKGVSSPVDYTDLRGTIATPVPKKSLSQKGSFFFGGNQGSTTDLYASFITIENASGELKDPSEAESLVRHFIDMFDIKFLNIKNGRGVLGRGVDGNYLQSFTDEFGGESFQEVNLQFHRLNGEVEDLRKYYQSRWWSQVDDQFHNVSTLAHELSHSVDFDRKVTSLHSDKITKILQKTIPGLRIPPTAERSKILATIEDISGPVISSTLETAKTREAYLDLLAILRYNRSLIERYSSGYSAFLPEELFAEVLRHGVLSANQSRLSREMVALVRSLPRSK